jgi:hypothetical protein
MRYLRKLLIMTAAIAAVAAMTATTASAAVEVKDANGEPCGQATVCEISLSGYLEVSAAPGYGSGSLECSMQATMQVSDSGALDITQIAPTLGGYTCSLMDDCDNAGWSGQIYTPDEYGSGSEDFVAEIIMCLRANSNVAAIQLGIDDIQAPPPYLSYQSWSLEEQQYGGPDLLIDGSLFDHVEQDIVVTDVE